LEEKERRGRSTTKGDKKQGEVFMGLSGFLVQAGTLPEMELEQGDILLQEEATDLEGGGEDRGDRSV